MIRMGSVVKEPLQTNNPKIIDYPLRERTDLLDIYLGAKCRFFLCDGAGPASIPMAFRRPIVWANYVQLETIISFGPQDLFIPKKLWLSKEQRFLTLHEILKLEVKGTARMKQYYEQLGIEPIENTPEEITALTLEMDERLKGTWQTTEEDEQLQRCFWTIVKSNELNQTIRPRIGVEFLRQNREFLK